MHELGWPIDPNRQYVQKFGHSKIHQFEGYLKLLNDATWWTTQEKTEEVQNIRRKKYNVGTKSKKKRFGKIWRGDWWYKKDKRRWGEENDNNPLQPPPRPKINKLKKEREVVFSVRGGLGELAAMTSWCYCATGLFLRR